MHQGKLLFCDTPANLKAQLGKGVLSVTSPEPRRLRDELEDADGISSLVLTGDGVHVVVDDAARRIPEFEARLQARRHSLRRDSTGRADHRRSVCRCGRARGASAPCLRPANSVVVENLVKRFGDFVAVDQHQSRSRARARSSAFWARTARANPPRFACCAACSSPLPAARRWRDSTWAASPKRCARTSATCRRNFRSTTI